MDAIYAAERLLLLKGGLGLFAITIAICVCLGMILGHSRRTSRRLTSEAAEFRALATMQAGHILQLEADVSLVPKLRHDLAAAQLENRRLIRIRVKTEEGCKMKDDELQLAKVALQEALELIKRLQQAPTLTSEL